MVREDADFSSGLSLMPSPGMQMVKDNYTSVNAKKSRISYTANKRIIRLQNSAGKKINIIFQVSNDGVALRYEFPESAAAVKIITEELTTYHFDKGTRAWLQPMSVAKSGWQQSNPSYEEHYEQDIPVGTPSKAGWVYPALFKTGDTWLLISENFTGQQFLWYKTDQ